MTCLAWAPTTVNNPPHTMAAAVTADAIVFIFPPGPSAGASSPAGHSAGLGENTTGIIGCTQRSGSLTTGVMTLHGLGMVGLWFVAGMARMSVLLARYVKPTVGVSWIAFAATIV